MERPSQNASLAGGKYELIEEIGRGGMGSVWRAHAVLLDRPCAIKFLHPESADQAVSRERFVNEARLAARLRSAHTVTIFDVDFMDGVPFIAMELLPGESLQQRLDRGPLTPGLTVQLVRQVALGLADAHEAGLVHRDLKPDNIFIVREKPLHVKLLDFGVAKNVHSNVGLRTVTGAIIGTPHYMSPEQAMGKPLDARSDLWALGVVAHRCLTGHLPFDGESWQEVLLKIVHGDIPPITGAGAPLPKAVDRWWQRVMRRDPQQRPATALAMADSFEEAVLGTPSRRDAHQPSESAIRMRSAELDAVGRPNRSWRIGVLVALGLGALAGAAYFANGTTLPSAPGAAPTVTVPAPAPGTSPTGIGVPAAVAKDVLPLGTDVPPPEPTQPATPAPGRAAASKTPANASVRVSKPDADRDAVDTSATTDPPSPSRASRVAAARAKRAATKPARVKTPDAPLDPLAAEPSDVDTNLGF